MKKTNKLSTQHSALSTKKSLPLGFQPIQDSCEQFAFHNRNLGSLIGSLNKRIADIQTTHMPDIRAEATLAAAVRVTLLSQVDANRPLFQSPRTRIFSDIKVGLQKQKGRIEIDDEEKTIALLAKHAPDQLDTVAPQTRKISKEALGNLPADLLKKIAVRVTSDTDAIIIKPQDSDVEKAVAALLAESSPLRLDRGEGQG